MGIERRRYKRWRVSAPVKIELIGPAKGLYWGSLSRDVSAGGLKVIMSEFLPKGSKLKVELFLENVKRLFRARARLVWVEQLPWRDDAFRVGMEFMEIEKRDKAELMKLADYYAGRN